MGSLTLQTPSVDHVQFDQMCAEVDEFEHLPALASASLDHDDECGQDTVLDDRILAALVSPVY